MSIQSPLPNYGATLLTAGATAAILSGLTLGLFATLQGLPPWAPLNATAHLLHGPSAGAFTGLDWSHTAIGAFIHVASAFFWAIVAFLVLRLAGGGNARAAWIAGLSTAIVAGVIDYGLMPSRLTPGWELVLPPLQVAGGLLALGVGLAIGMHAALILFPNAGSRRL